MANRTRRLERSTLSILPRPYSGWEMMSPTLYRCFGSNDLTSAAAFTSCASSRSCAALFAASGSDAARAALRDARGSLLGRASPRRRRAEGVARIAHLTEHLLRLAADQRHDVVVGHLAALAAPGVDLAAHAEASGRHGATVAPGDARDPPLADVDAPATRSGVLSLATFATLGSSDASRLTSTTRRPRVRSTFSCSPGDSDAYISR